MSTNTKDVRTAKEIKECIKKATKEWQNADKESYIKLLSKSEYCDAVNYYEARKAADSIINNFEYENWINREFIKSYKNIDINHPFWQAKPVCFSIIAEKEKESEIIEETYNIALNNWIKKKHFRGKEKKELDIAARNQTLFRLRGDNWVSYSELIDLLNVSDSEIWKKRLTYEYMYAMAILYKVLEARGIEPTFEEECKLKWELFERDVKLCNDYTFNFEGIEEFKIDRYNLTFGNLAFAYLGFKKKDLGLRFIIEQDGTPIIMSAKPKRAIEEFKNENLRTLIYNFDSLNGIYRHYSEELKRYGINIEEITYENIIKDEKWRNFVFKEFNSYVFSGEKDTTLSYVSFPMEALIDRTFCLKRKFEEFESKYTDKELKLNEEYLHIKWEYNATKLQVLLLNIKKATDIKQYLTMSNKEKEESEYIIEYWTTQLGKYANEWLYADLDLANIYIPGGWNNIKEKELIGGWNTSKEALYKKREISDMFIEINKQLTQLGSCSPLYNEDFPYKCPNAEIIKHISRENFEFSDYAFVFAPIYYNRENNNELWEFNNKLDISNNAYKKGIIRFDKEYLRKQNHAIELAKGNNNTIQDAFSKSSEGYRIKNEFNNLIEKGISPETLKNLIDNMEEK